MQRDQFIHQQLPVNDQKDIQEQYHRRLTSKYYHNLQEPSTKPTQIHEGTLVYIKTKKNKSQSQPRHLDDNVDGPWFHIRKFFANQLRNTTYKVHQSELCTVPSTPEVHRHHNNTDNNNDDPVNLPEGLQPHQQSNTPHSSNPPPPGLLNLDTSWPSKNATATNTPSSTSGEESSRPARLRHPSKYLDDYFLKLKERRVNDPSDPSSNPAPPCLIMWFTLFRISITWTLLAHYIFIDFLLPVISFILQFREGPRFLFTLKLLYSCYFVHPMTSINARIKLMTASLF